MAFRSAVLICQPCKVFCSPTYNVLALPGKMWARGGGGGGEMLEEDEWGQMRAGWFRQTSVAMWTRGNWGSHRYVWNAEGKMVCWKDGNGSAEDIFPKREKLRRTKSGERRKQVKTILSNQKEISDCKDVVGEGVAMEHRRVVRMTGRWRGQKQSRTKRWKLKKRSVE